jgi:hypothetical protein
VVGSSKRLVEEEEARLVALRGALREERRELQPLGLTARERVGGLPEAEIAETDRAEGVEALEQSATGHEELRGLVHGQLQDVVDVLSLERDLHDLLAEAAAVALVADHFHVGEELHVDRDYARALTRLAAAAVGVEREHARGDAVQLRAGRLGQELPDLVPGLDVRRRIGARRTSDGRLIDELHVVDQLRSLDGVDLPRVQTGHAAHVAPVAIEEAVADERGLARAGDARDRDELSEWDLRGHAAQVVLARVDDAQHAGAFVLCRSAHRRWWKEACGGRCRPAVDDLTAVLARARAELHVVIGPGDDRGIVLHDDDRVSGVLETSQDGQEPFRVARMQSHGRLVDDVHRLGER